MNLDDGAIWCPDSPSQGRRPLNENSAAATINCAKVTIISTAMQEWYRYCGVAKRNWLCVWLGKETLDWIPQFLYRLRSRRHTHDFFNCYQNLRVNKVRTLSEHVEKRLKCRHKAESVLISIQSGLHYVHHRRIRPALDEVIVIKIPFPKNPLLTLISR